MRNLKRALSLVMAMALIVGMMVVSASAAGKDFTDMDEIDHTEAVEVMTALNVIAGKEDGSYYDPDGSLTRAEMAKVVSYVMNGGVEPNIGTKVVPTYSDIDGHWAEKYIEYCTSMGIINGDGAGKFNPEGTLTGEQAAKMFLTAMGYNANVFGFTGNDWAINVGRYANEAGLYKELGDITPSAVISRDDAAQMAYNAIQATMMKRTWSQDMTTGQLTETYAPWTVEKDNHTVGYTLLNDKFGGAIEVGYLTSFTYDVAKAQWTYNFNSTSAWFNGADLTNATNKIGAESLKCADDYTDLFGKQVKVIYNDSTNDEVYGVYLNDSAVLATGATGQIGDIDTDADTAVINGTSIKFDDVDAANVVFNWNGTSHPAADTVAELKAVNTAFTFEVVDNDGDSKADAILYLPMQIAKISYVGTDSVTVGAPINKTHKVSDIAIYDGYAKDDWMAQISSGMSDTGVVTYEKMEVKTGTITGVKTVDGVENYLIDGVWYTNGSPATNLVTLNVNDTIDFVAVGSKFFYTKISESGLTGKDVVMVVTAGQTAGVSGISTADTQVKLLFSDGETEVVGVAKINNAPANYTSGDQTGTANQAVGHLYTYRIDSDGNYELTSISGTNLAGYDKVGSNAAYNDNKIGGAELADDAIVFALTNGSQGNAAATNKGAVYSGREIKNNYTTASFGTPQDAGYVSALVGKINGFDYARVAVLVGNVEINTGSNYGYLTTDAYEGREGSDVYRYFTLWTADGEITVKEKSAKGLDGLKAGAVITYDVTDTSGVVKNVGVPVVITSAVTGWDEESGKIQFKSGLSNKITDDTVVIYVDSSKTTGSEGGSISIANSPAANVYNNNVRYICALSAAYVDLLLVDINNDMKDAPQPPAMGAGADADDIEGALSSSPIVEIAGAVAENTVVTIPENKTLIISENQTKTGLEVTVSEGATLEIADGKGAPAGTKITAAPGATVKFGTRTVVSPTAGLYSETGDITLELAGDGTKMTYTLAANTTLRGALELTSGDTLKAADGATVKLSGEVGAVITVYSAPTITSITYDKLTVNADAADTVSSESLPATADQVYTWGKGNDTNPKSGWIVTSRGA